MSAEPGQDDVTFVVTSSRAVQQWLSVAKLQTGSRLVVWNEVARILIFVPQLLTDLQFTAVSVFLAESALRSGFSHNQSILTITGGQRKGPGTGRER